MTKAKNPQRLSLAESVKRFENFDNEQTRTATAAEVLEFRQRINSKHLENQIIRSVAEARYFGLSWQTIGAILNLPAEFAEQKFNSDIKIFDGAFGFSPSIQ